MPDNTEDLSLSRIFRLVDGSLSIEDTFEKILQASAGGDVSKLSAGVVGTVIDSKYRVLSLLGEGGMGAVYRVRHLLLDKEMALKTFRTANLGPAAWQRFQREAQTIAKLTHPNIVQVFDFGVSEQNFPYYTMELLLGESLAERLVRLKRLSIDQVLPIFVAVAAGMAHAHRLGIVHRDIKPANIFIEQGKGDGIPKVVDFGLAKLAASQSLDDQSLTGKGLVFGSPLYMSPEQSRGLGTDQRTDIYSFGCSLYHVLTGKPPFEGDGILATLSLHQQEVPPRLAQAAPDVKFPERLEAIVSKLLAKNAKERYQSFEAVGKDLSLLDLSGIKAGATAHGGEKISKAEFDLEGETGGATGNDPDLSHRAGALSGFWLLAVAAVVLIMGLAGVVVLLNDRHSSRIVTHKAEVDLDPALPVSPRVRIGDSERAKALDVSEIQVPSQRYLQAPKRYLLQKKDGSTLFRFPDQSLGDFKWNDAAGKKIEKPACGQLEVPAGAQFKADQLLAEQPNLFLGFGPDDLTSLGLRRGYVWSNRHFAEIARLRSIQYLYLPDISLDTSDLKCLNGLPNLTHLNVSGTHLVGQDLVQLSRIDQLKNLEVNHLMALTPLWDKLQNGCALVDLSAKGCGIEDGDLRKIARINSLATLCIDGNPAITAAGLSALAGLPQLSVLRMGNEQLGPDIIAVMHNFKHLMIVRIDTSSWSPQDKQRLTLALPEKCKQEPPE